MTPSLDTEMDYTERPLPSLPSYRIPFPTPKLIRKSLKVHDRPPRPVSSAVKSMAWRRMQRAVVHALTRPHILACLLQYLPWSDFYLLLSTCADMRRLWDNRDLRDVIFSQFVPGYRYALTHRDFSKSHDIDISLQDLDLLRWYFILFCCATF